MVSQELTFASMLGSTRCVRNKRVQMSKARTAEEACLEAGCFRARSRLDYLMPGWESLSDDSSRRWEPAASTVMLLLLSMWWVKHQSSQAAEAPKVGQVRAVGHRQLRICCCSKGVTTAEDGPIRPSQNLQTDVENASSSSAVQHYMTIAFNRNSLQHRIDYARYLISMFSQCSKNCASVVRQSGT